MRIQHRLPYHVRASLGFVLLAAMVLTVAMTKALAPVDIHLWPGWLNAWFLTLFALMIALFVADFRVKLRP